MYPFNFHTKRTSFSKSGKLISIKRNRLRDSSFEGLKFPEEFIMEDVRPRWSPRHYVGGGVGAERPMNWALEFCNFSLLPARLPDGKWFTIRKAVVYYPHSNGLLSGALAVGEPLCKEEE
ncbi:hypothetical protein HELRODRAFT_182987 [Helobdella robusta]|uniref:Uncharacterized protein n=1 Tax=Helobdella robusta TaxID=6412 RepID=T1FJ20_HELRO|nr:hypothetical protein HELRODRAFT_182987 [Helobdella robusta]ESN89977.1 hypothetical protein HELRODRAFT_182987 [Helobdella robusta]